MREANLPCAEWLLKKGAKADGRPRASTIYQVRFPHDFLDSPLPTLSRINPSARLSGTATSTCSTTTVRASSLLPRSRFASYAA